MFGSITLFPKFRNVDFTSSSNLILYHFYSFFIIYISDHIFYMSFFKPAHILFLMKIVLPLILIGKQEGCVF